MAVGPKIYYIIVVSSYLRYQVSIDIEGFR